MDWVEIFIEMPARFIGAIAGELFHVAWFFAAVAAAIAIGRFVHACISLRHLNVIIAVIVGVYVTVVLVRAESFLAAGIFDAIEGSDDDY